MRIIAVLALFAFLQGCTAVPGIAQVQGVFVLGTDKTIEDHVISLTSGKNCSTIRRERGLTYCVEDEPRLNPNIYCYKTLARVTCYDRPDPYTGLHQRVDRNDHNLPK